MHVCATKAAAKFNFAILHSAAYLDCYLIPYPMKRIQIFEIYIHVTILFPHLEFLRIR